MLNLNNGLSKKDIMKVFWEKVAGKQKGITGRTEEIRP